MNKKAVNGIVNVQRRTWNRDEYEKKALDREVSSSSGTNGSILSKLGYDKNKSDNIIIPTEIASDTATFTIASEDAAKPSGTSLAFASVHTSVVNFDNLVGKAIPNNIEKSSIATSVKESSEDNDIASSENATSGKVTSQGSKIQISTTNPFYCPICDYHSRDSAAFLTHRNSRTHLARLGFSTSVQKASADDAKNRLKKHIEAKSLSSNTKTNETSESSNFNDNEHNDDTENKNKNKKRDREEEVAESQNNQDDNEMMKMLGFSSFSGSDNSTSKNKKKS